MTVPFVITAWTVMLTGVIILISRAKSILLLTCFPTTDLLSYYLTDYPTILLLADTD